jgi:hypothetical protein
MQMDCQLYQHRDLGFATRRSLLELGSIKPSMWCSVTPFPQIVKPVDL